MIKKLLFCVLMVLFFSAHIADSYAQTYDDYVTRSFDYIEQDSLALAEDAMRSALRLEPGNPGNGLLLANMGTIQRRLGKLKEAEASYTIGLGFLPENLTLLNSRASLYAEMAEYTKAIDDYTTIIAKEAENEDAYYQRALCRLMNSDTLGARLDLELIDKFNPQSAKSRLGMAYVYKAQRMWREAAELYDALIERNPKSASLLRERAEVHYLSGRMGAALADIEKSISMGPRDPYSYILRAQIRYAKGDKEYARRDLNQALELGLPEAETGDLLLKLK